MGIVGNVLAWLDSGRTPCRRRITPLSRVTLSQRAILRRPRPQTNAGSPAPSSQLSQTISFPKAYYVLLKSHYQNRGDSAISLVCKPASVWLAG